MLFTATVRKSLYPAVCLLLLFGSPASDFAQNKTTAGDVATKTKIELFKSKIGIAVVRGYTRIGSLVGAGTSGTVAVTSEEITDGSTSVKEYGISIKVVDISSESIVNIAYIDYDEIDALLKGIDFVSKVSNKSTKMDDFDASYHTRGGIVISKFVSYTEEIKMSVKAEGLVPSTCVLPITDFPELKKLILDAKRKIIAVKSAK